MCKCFLQRLLENVLFEMMNYDDRKHVLKDFVFDIAMQYRP